MTAQPDSGPGTAQQHVLAWLRREIVDGGLRPGQRVLQDDIAERTGVSIAPVREALRVLEQEGQVTYFPRRGYLVTELNLADLEEIYELRRVLEGRAARAAFPNIDDEALARITLAAKECADAAEVADIARELAANRRFHFAILGCSRQPHLMRLLSLLWDSTEAYRAMYYNASAERRASLRAHRRIVVAVRIGEPTRLVAELDAHRAQGLEFLRGILSA